VQGQGQVELGLGGKVSAGIPLIGRLPDHSSLALLKTLNSATAPQPPP